MKSDSLYQINSLFQHYVDQGWMPCGLSSDVLGMESTYFFLPENMYSGLVTACVAGADSIIIPIGEMGGELNHPDYPKSGAKSYYSGGSGLNGSVRDYYLFLHAMLHGGKGRTERILTDSSVSMMSQVTFPPWCLMYFPTLKGSSSALWMNLITDIRDDKVLPVKVSFPIQVQTI